jgi:hypothetical protein
MKKVSEVSKELDAFGCNRQAVVDFCVKMGWLEEDEEPKFKVGDIWEDNGCFFKILEINPASEDKRMCCTWKTNDMHVKEWFSDVFTDNKKLIWRDE